MFEVEVRSRIVGAPSELPTVSFEVDSEQLTVHDLIRRTVASQLLEMARSHELDRERARRAVQRQYLTNSELHEQALVGKVGLPTELPPAPAPSDVQQETARAVDGFRRKTFLILVDGKPVEHLEETLVLAPASKVVFLRLMPLVGG